jgi:hypothetical protein
MRLAARWLADVIDGSGREKDHHDWGQGEAEACYLPTWLTEPGDLVRRSVLWRWYDSSSLQGLGAEMAGDRKRQNDSDDCPQTVVTMKSQTLPER